MAKKTSKAKKDLAEQTDPRASLDSAALLAVSKPLLAKLEVDLLERVKASPTVTAALDARFQAEKANRRTAESFAGWTSVLATQVAAAWLLSCVFVRTLEDRGLLKQNRLAGPGAEDSQRQFFQIAPSLTERDYLLTVFRELAHHAAAKDLFDAEHSLVWKLSPSAEVAKELLALFRAPTATAPAFRFGQSSTRFLGDLYQDLSEEVRKRYALLQTPDFVEEFILDRTLEPAIARFGLDDTTLIDPTCGSGHFLLGAFNRLFEHQQRAAPDVDPRVAALRALDGVYGADINPYAVAIARFRLTLSFLDKAGYAKLADAPTLPLHLVVADSLRINAQHHQPELWHQDGVDVKTWLGAVFSVEDERAAKDVLFRKYAAVVANPPYITVKDAAMREVYRNMYPSCHRSYSLSVPFCERVFQLARPRGYTGQITANSFMKREFGKKLIEEFLPTINLDRIVNTAGAYIPGHGTPTVLLFGTKEEPQGAAVLSVLAKRGEPSTPDAPSEGLVWRSIVERGDELGFENDYISVARVTRETLRKHPWSLGGGGAAELKELLEERSETTLESLGADIGTGAVTREDDVYLLGDDVLKRWGIPQRFRREAVVGENTRDWSIAGSAQALWPYDETSLEPVLDRTVEKALWPWRTQLKIRVAFGKTQIERGLPWTAYSMFFAERARTPLTIAFAFVATHNHFVLKRGVTVFGRTAPIIKLAGNATEDDHLALLAYLNSSVACFWMKQVFSPKGMHNGSASNATPFLVRFEFDGTKLARLPVPGNFGERREAYAELGRRADALARERHNASLLTSMENFATADELEATFQQRLQQRQALLRKLVTIQEDIDWLTYAGFGLAAVELTGSDHDQETDLGARAFEVALYRAGAGESADWFRWNQTGPRDPAPSIRSLVEKRVAAISALPTELGVVERGEFKRRWVQPSGKAAQSLETDDKVLEDEVIDWIHTRLESHVSRLNELVTRRELDVSFAGDRALCVAYEWASRRNRIAAVLNDLVTADSVPFLAAARYSETGMQIYERWQETWEQQRAEDRGDLSLVKSPPRYGQDDFEADVYHHRGPLDVPKERYISYPFCESDNDSEPVYGWSGWDHQQRALALGKLYLRRKNDDGWTVDRLTPMLAGLLEQLPWVNQWHPDRSDEFGGQTAGEYFSQFLDGECRHYNLTRDDLRAWRPRRKARTKTKVGTRDATAGENARVVKKRLSALERKLQSAKHEPVEPTEAE